MALNWLAKLSIKKVAKLNIKKVAKLNIKKVASFPLLITYYLTRINTCERSAARKSSPRSARQVLLVDKFFLLIVDCEQSRQRIKSFKMVVETDKNHFSYFLWPDSNSKVDLARPDYEAL